MDFRDIQVRETYREFILNKLEHFHKTRNWLAAEANLSNDTIDRILTSNLELTNSPSLSTRSRIFNALECRFEDFQNFYNERHSDNRNLPIKATMMGQLYSVFPVRNRVPLVITLLLGAMIAIYGFYYGYSAFTSFDSTGNYSTLETKNTDNKNEVQTSVAKDDVIGGQPTEKGITQKTEHGHNFVNVTGNISIHNKKLENQ